MTSKQGSKFFESSFEVLGTIGGIPWFERIVRST